MDIVISLIVLAVLIVVAVAIARFVLKLTAKAVGCLVTAILAIGILFILWLILF